LTFGVSGKLYRNVLVMYDRETESLWSHLLGSAFSGPLKGSRLTTVPSVHADWQTWLKAYPTTLVLSKAKSPYGRYVEDPYTGYYVSPQTGLIPPVERDARVFPKEFVLGVASSGGAKAYPFSQLGKRPVVNDEVGGQPLLVAFDSRALTGVVFDRRVRGRILTFEPAPGEAPLSLRDRETQSRWAGLKGEAVDGPLRGARLLPVPFTTAFWFGWRDYYPKTEVFLGEGR